MCEGTTWRTEDGTAAKACREIARLENMYSGTDESEEDCPHQDIDQSTGRSGRDMRLAKVERFDYTATDKVKIRMRVKSTYSTEVYGSLEYVLFTLDDVLEVLYVSRCTVIYLKFGVFYISAFTFIFPHSSLPICCFLFHNAIRSHRQRWC